MGEVGTSGDFCQKTIYAFFANSERINYRSPGIIARGGPTRTSADFSVPRLAGSFLII
jgi:hypothetical protein